MTDLTKLTMGRGTRRSRKKDIHGSRTDGRFLSAIEKGNSALNAYVLATPEHARIQAKDSDKRIAAGKGRSARRPADRATRISSARKASARRRARRSSTDFKPTYESTVGQNLWDAGAIMLASSTTTSSRWDRRTRRALSAMSSALGVGRARTAKPSNDKLVPGWGRQAALLRRSRRASVWRQRPPIPAAPSDSRLH